MLRGRHLVVLALLSVAALPRGAAAAIVESRDVRGPSGEALCLDVAGAKQANGTDLILYRCHGGTNQAFTFNRGSGELRSNLGSWCVDVSGGRAVDGNRVQLWQCNGSPAQRFLYDHGGGRLAFAGDSSLCVDATGASMQLHRCGDSAAQRFDVSTPWGDRRFDELTWLVAHNAYNNSEDGRWTVPNQSRGLVHALDDGVRGLMLDVWSFESSTTRCIVSLGSDCYARDLYLCHENCGGVPGVQYALPRQTLAGALGQVVRWLAAHPDEIVTVFLEDYSAHDELRGVLDRVPGLRALQLDPYAWGVSSHGWPRARDLVDANQRLLLISDRSDKRDLGVGFGPDLTVENYWSMGLDGSNRRCYSRWDGVPLDRTDAGFQRLFVMNHFRDIPTGLGSAVDNDAANLRARLNDECLPAARRKPNYVAVDFYEMGGGGGAMQFVREVGAGAAILFSDGAYGGRAQLIAPGYLRVGDLGLVGNDAVSSLKVSSGWFITLYEHDSFGGRSRTFTVDTPWVGNDFNDLASSAQLGLSQFAFDDPGVPFER